MSKFGASTWQFVRNRERNCAKKIFNVRENLARTKQMVRANFQGSVCERNKQIEGVDKVTTSKRRALFHASDSSTHAFTGKSNHRYGTKASIIL